MSYLDVFNQSLGYQRQQLNSESLYSEQYMNSVFSLDNAKEQVKQDQIKSMMEKVQIGAQKAEEGLGVAIGVGHLAKNTYQMGKHILNYKAIKGKKAQAPSEEEEFPPEPVEGETTESNTNVRGQYESSLSEHGSSGNVQDQIMDEDPEAGFHEPQQPDVSAESETAEAETSGEITTAETAEETLGTTLGETLGTVASSLGAAADVAGLALGGYGIYESIKSIGDIDKEEAQEEVREKTIQGQLDAFNSFSNPVPNFGRMAAQPLDSTQYRSGGFAHF